MRRRVGLSSCHCLVFWGGYDIGCSINESHLRCIPVPDIFPAGWVPCCSFILDLLFKLFLGDLLWCTLSAPSAHVFHLIQDELKSYEVIFFVNMFFFFFLNCCVLIITSLGKD